MLLPFGCNLIFKLISIRNKSEMRIYMIFDFKGDKNIRHIRIFYTRIFQEQIFKIIQRILYFTVENLILIKLEKLHKKYQFGIRILVP